MDVKVEYTSCGCNRSPFAADWGCNNLLAYGGCNSVIIAKTKGPSKVEGTLVGHKNRVNCVRWIRGWEKATEETELISGSVDKTAIIWRKNSENIFAPLATLSGHTGPVNTVAGVYTTDTPSPRLLVATAAADFTVRVWERKEGEDAVTCIQTIDLPRSGFAFCLTWHRLPGTQVPLLVTGNDDQKIHLFVEQNGQMTSALSLPGHEDWVRDVDVCVDDGGDLLIVSCGQDHYLRVWRVSARNHDDGPGTAPEWSLDEGGEIRMKETTFTASDDAGGSHKFAVSLESVLQGHENWVYSVRWQPPQRKALHQPLAILSASMDKTMILWRPDPSTGIWIDQVRVGDIGGNTLGFYGGLFSPDGAAILSHGYQGAFNIWYQSQDSSSWLPGVTVGGHFSGVQDVAWEPSEGAFVISVSLDQTSRLHGHWQAADKQEATWHELGRPQVHGYDMMCVAPVSRWRYASGADEKVVRVFEAPGNVLDNLGRLLGVNVDNNRQRAPEGATVPALGLSNKAVYSTDGTDGDGTPGESTTGKSTVLQPAANSQYKEVFFSPLALQAPPSEDNLIQNTLWPEVHKLYGHGYEVYTMAAHPKGTVLATACKASKAEHAAVLLWETSSWRQVARLESHALTVTRLVFSHSGEHLLSVSRDRTWSVYRGRTAEQPDTDPLYSRLAYTDKKTSVHTRIIWCAAWSHDDKYFITVSRDKKAVVWTSSPSSPSGSCRGDYNTAGILGGLPDSATAVDFAPVLTADNCYLVAIGLDNGLVLLYKWSPTVTGPEAWTLTAQIPHSSGHHQTVKRLRFRPITALNTTKDAPLQLASCGADHIVRVWTIHSGNSSPSATS